MSKIPSNKLYNLVKSLSGSEKRYFKLYSNAGNEDKSSKYIQLFDAIDLQETYDEESLKAVIYEGRKIQSRKFSELKAYLYDLLLKSLQSYDEKVTVNYKLKGLLHSVRVLYKRSHYNECKELLQKSRIIAADYEHFTSMLEILRWEKKIAYAEIDIAFLNNEMSRIAAEEKAALTKLANRSALKHIYLRMLTYLHKYAGDNKEQHLETLTRFIKHPLLENKAYPKSYTGRLFYYKIYTLYYAAVYNWSESYNIGKVFLSMMESKPKLTREHSSEYIAALNNFSKSCILLKKHDELKTCLKKIKETSPVTNDDAFRIHSCYYKNKLSFCIATGAFEDGVKLLGQHFEETKQFKKEEFLESDFYYIYFYIYFGVNNFDTALEYLEKWRILPHSLARKDVQVVAGMLRLIVHYELGDHKFLNKNLHYQGRSQRKQNHNFKSENTLLGFFKKSKKTSEEKVEKEAFIPLLETMQNLSGSASEKPVFNAFDFIAWIDSKIQQLPFSEVVRNNYFS